jgi:cell shape-determining protein MreD
MIAFLVAIPILSGLLIIQSALVSRIPLLLGTPDLILLTIVAWSLQKRVRTAWHWAALGGLMVSVLSALPFGSILLGYLISVGVGLFLRKQISQAPILGMLITIFFGSLICQGIDLLALRAFGTSLPFLVTLNQIMLPSLLLNLVLAIPVFVVIGDFADLLYPVELEM